MSEGTDAGAPKKKRSKKRAKISTQEAQDGSSTELPAVYEAHSQRFAAFLKAYSIHCRIAALPKSVRAISITAGRVMGDTSPDGMELRHLLQLAAICKDIQFWWNTRAGNSEFRDPVERQEVRAVSGEVLEHADGRSLSIKMHKEQLSDRDIQKMVKRFRESLEAIVAEHRSCSSNDGGAADIPDIEPIPYPQDNSALDRQPFTLMVKRTDGDSCRTRQTVETILDHLKQQPWYGGQVSYVHRIDAQPPRYEPLRHSQLHPALVEGLRKHYGKGEGEAMQFYTHQARGIDAALTGKDVVVCTSTSSGKSLVYNAATFHRLFEDPNSCAVFIFPTKALAQDQLRALKALILAMPLSYRDRIRPATFDGDTPKSDRSHVMQHANIILTNPDMLHVTFLPSHRRFERVLRHLSYVVIDEAHVYKGAFGAHTAAVLRRLARVCYKSYQSSPQFICCSATIANPHEHFWFLVGQGGADDDFPLSPTHDDDQQPQQQEQEPPEAAHEPGGFFTEDEQQAPPPPPPPGYPKRQVVVCQNDGSPCGSKCYVLWNPPYMSAEEIWGPTRAVKEVFGLDEEDDQGGQGNEDESHETPDAANDDQSMDQPDGETNDNGAPAPAVAPSAAPPMKRRKKRGEPENGYLRRSHRLADKRRDEWCKSLFTSVSAEAIAALEEREGEGGGGPMGEDERGELDELVEYYVRERQRPQDGTRRPPRLYDYPLVKFEYEYCMAHNPPYLRNALWLLKQLRYFETEGLFRREGVPTLGLATDTGNDDVQMGHQQDADADAATPSDQPSPSPAETIDIENHVIDLLIQRITLKPEPQSPQRHPTIKQEPTDDDQQPSPSPPPPLPPPPAAKTKQEPPFIKEEEEATAAAGGMRNPPPRVMPPEDESREGFRREVRKRGGGALISQDRLRTALEGTAPGRRSPIVETSALLAELVKNGIRTLAFCKWRKVVEVVLIHTRDLLKEWGHPDLAEKVVSYRAGYVASERRRIEKQIFSGDVLGVTCTNALELGIDIGTLDACILLGFPGSIASMLQQFGRAGRGTRSSISFMVSFACPVDQWCAKHGQELFEKAPEAASLDPFNPSVIKQHLLCAAKECPPLEFKHDGELFTAGWEAARTELKRILAELEANGNITRVNNPLTEQPSHYSWEMPQQTSASAAAAPVIDLTDDDQQDGGSDDEEEVIPEIADGRVAPIEDLTQWRMGVLVNGRMGKAAIAVNRQGEPVRDIGESRGRGLPGSLSTDPHPLVVLRNIDEARFQVVPVPLGSREPLPTPNTIDSSRRDHASRDGGGWGSDVDFGREAGGFFASPREEVLGGQEVIDEIEYHEAFFMVHPGAVYLNRGKEYLVSHLDLHHLVARVQPAKVPYYTRTRDHTDVDVLTTNQQDDSIDGIEVSTYRGRLQVCLKVWGYRKFWRSSSQPFDSTVGLGLPPIAYQTDGFWFDIERPLRDKLDKRGLDIRGGIHGAEHALLAVVPLFVLCDRTDISCECPNPWDERLRPLRLVVFDSTPGGVGISMRAFQQARGIARAALQLVNDCTCDQGCPACVCHPNCGEYNAVISKPAALVVLRAMVRGYEGALDEESDIDENEAAGGGATDDLWGDGAGMMEGGDHDHDHGEGDGEREGAE